MSVRTTTIRVDVETHQTLRRLAAVAGTTLVATIREPAEALRRQRFAQHLTAEFAALRSDPEAWDAYLSGADVNSVYDGIS